MARPQKRGKKRARSRSPSDSPQPERRKKTSRNSDVSSGNQNAVASTSTSEPSAAITHASDVHPLQGINATGNIGNHPQSAVGSISNLPNHNAVADGSSNIHVQNAVVVNSSSASTSNAALPNFIPGSNVFILPNMPIHHIGQNGSRNRNTTGSDQGNVPPPPPPLAAQNSQHSSSEAPTDSTPSSPMSTQASSETLYDYALDEPVTRLLLAEIDFKDTVRRHMWYGVLGSVVQDALHTLCMSEHGPPGGGVEFVRRARDAVMIPREVPWTAMDPLAGIRTPAQLQGLHFFIQNAQRTNRFGLRFRRPLNIRDHYSKYKAPQPRDIRPLPATGYHVAPSIQDIAETRIVPKNGVARVDLPNLFRVKDDGMYVITVPGSRDIFLVQRDRTVVYKHHSGASFVIPPRLCGYLLAKLRARNFYIPSLPSVALYAHYDNLGPEDEAHLKPEEGELVNSLRKDKHQYAPGTFSIIDALIRHPDPFESLVANLSGKALITLYSKSKLFQYLFNSDYSRHINANLAAHVSDAKGILPWKCFLNLCINDPCSRIDPQFRHLADLIPGLKYVSMVHYQFEVAQDIRSLLTNQGHTIPEECVEVLMRMSFAMMIKSNAARIGLFHNKSYWTLEDLRLAWLLIVKIDLALTNPVYYKYPNGSWRNTPSRLRQHLFGLNSLTDLRDVLKHGYEKFVDKFGSVSSLKAKAVVKLDRSMNVCEIDDEVHHEPRLIGVDRLVIQEGFARGCGLQLLNLDYLLYGWI